jgi:hypothetical protein
MKRWPRTRLTRNLVSLCILYLDEVDDDAFLYDLIDAEVDAIFAKSETVDDACGVCPVDGLDATKSGDDVMSTEELDGRLRSIYPTDATLPYHTSMM